MALVLVSLFLLALIGTLFLSFVGFTNQLKPKTEASHCVRDAWSSSTQNPVA